MTEAQTDIIEMRSGSLRAAELTEAVRNSTAGAVVTFIGVVRDHSEDRDGELRSGVVALEYEAYEGPALERMAELVALARREWPSMCRVALVHRVGTLAVGDDAVVVAVSAPHRGVAFAAAGWLIDQVKATVPIWKEETWSGGRDAGVDASPLAEPSAPVDPASAG